MYKAFIPKIGKMGTVSPPYDVLISRASHQHNKKYFSSQQVSCARTCYSGTPLPQLINCQKSKAATLTTCVAMKRFINIPNISDITHAARC